MSSCGRYYFEGKVCKKTRYGTNAHQQIRKHAVFCTRCVCRTSCFYARGAEGGPRAKKQKNANKLKTITPNGFYCACLFFGLGLFGFWRWALLELPWTSWSSSLSPQIAVSHLFPGQGGSQGDSGARRRPDYPKNPQNPWEPMKIHS